MATPFNKPSDLIRRVIAKRTAQAGGPPPYDDGSSDKDPLFPEPGDEESSTDIRSQAVEAYAGCISAHVENGFECAGEFYDEAEQPGVADYILSLGDLKSPEGKALLRDALAQVAKDYGV